MTGSLFVISAPSGAGKTSLTRAVIDRMADIGHEVVFSVSYTTRPPRPLETDGVDYHFVDGKRFEHMVETGSFLEHADVFGKRYGTGREVTEVERTAGRDVVLDIDWQGARQVKQVAPDAVSIFILPPVRSALEARLRDRGQDDDAIIEQRMAQACAEISHWAEYDYLVVNDQFEQAVDELFAIFRAQRLKRSVAEHGMAGDIARRMSQPR